MRLPLGVKMSLASTLLVALLVVFLGYVNTLKIRDLHAERADELSETFTQQATRRAETSAGVLAVSLREALEGTELGTLGTVVGSLVAGDPEIVYAKVADARGRVLADSTRQIDATELPMLDGGSALESRVEETDHGGKRVLEVRRPILAPGDDGAGATARGLVVFGYDVSDLTDRLAAVEQARDEGLRESLNFTLLIGLAALAFGALLSLVTAFRFAGPIRKLASTAARIGQGDLAARVAITSSDEVATLGQQFNYMAERLQHLLEDAVSRAELERELDLAREIQSVLVPGPGTHAAPGIEMAGYYEPASSCGGDFWDFAALPRGRSVVLVGDVTGHGVPAAMLTATAKACLDSLRHVHGENLQVAETMRVLDQVIRDAGHGSFFMTAAAAVLDTHQNTLFFTGAGHPPGLLLRWTDGGIKLNRLMSRGNRLGDGNPSGFEARRVRVSQGDLLVWYTDGLTDLVGTEGKAYGTRRLLRVLSRLERHASPEDVVGTIVDDMQVFRGGTALDDDVTFVAGRIL